MVIFGTMYPIRRFRSSIEHGREAVTFTDEEILADIQFPSDSSKKETEGGRREPRIKAWTNEKIQPEDQLDGTHADWVWYDNHWWKCMLCRYAGNTMLSHYVSEFVRVPENEPEEYLEEPEGAENETV